MLMPRSTLVAGAAFAILTLGACEGRESRDATTGAIRSPAVTDTAEAAAGRTDTAQASPTTAGKLTDANIVALLDEANKADSIAGALAVRKATSAEVKEFGKLMMSEHHALRVQGQALAKKLGMTPQPPADDPVQAAARREMAALQAAPKGVKFDRAYIEQEVAVHKAVIDLAMKAHGSTDNEQLKSLIEQAKPFLQKHLDRAEALQQRLGQPSA
jgi:putative membrane protein